MTPFSPLILWIKSLRKRLAYIFSHFWEMAFWWCAFTDKHTLPFSAIPDIHMGAYSLPTLYSWGRLLVPGRGEDNVLTDVVLLFSMMSGSECSWEIITMNRATHVWERGAFRLFLHETKRKSQAREGLDDFTIEGGINNFSFLQTLLCLIASPLPLSSLLCHSEPQSKWKGCSSLLHGQVCWTWCSFANKLSGFYQ